jgi:hypothetical protein
MSNLIPFFEEKYIPVRYMGVMGIKVQVTTVLVTCAVTVSILAGAIGGVEYEKLKQVKPQLYLMDKAKIHTPLPTVFEAKVRNVAELLKVQPEWLMAVMYSECRFDHDKYNLKGSGAVGLIQFMPETAKEMGTSTQAIANMSHEQQLDLVWRYLQAYREKYGDYKSLCDLYLAILYPKARTGDMCYTLYESPSKAYKQNIGLDEDKDGRVTVGDIDKRMKRLYPFAYVAGQKDNLNDTITVYKTEFATNE